MNNRKLPNFLIMGAQKCATTSLHHYLADHPDVYLPEEKETKFFVKPEKYARGLDYYLDTYFSGVTDETAIGEVDPDYMYFEDGIENICSSLDAARLKLVFILRNPVDRAYSHYMMTFRRGLEPLSFEEAVSSESDRIAKDWLSNMHYSYVERGKYIHQLERIARFVPKENMMFLLMEELQENPENAVLEVCRFLGVTERFNKDVIKQEFHRGARPKSLRFLDLLLRESYAKKLVRYVIASKKVREALLKKLIRINETDTKDMKMDPDFRSQLCSQFREYNTRLAGFIGKDLSKWSE